jgi:putative ABC transport system permease protein
MPNWNAEIRQRLANLKLEPAREAAIIEELAQDLEDCYAALLAGGASEAEAYQRTLAELQGSELLRRELQRVERQCQPEPILIGTNRRTTMIADVWQDLRFGVRMLAKQPSFTLIGVLTLALGIGANTAIFSVVNAVLLEALPYRDADRLVMVWEKSQARAQNVINMGNFFDWKTQSNSFEDMAAFVDARTNLTDDGEPLEIPAQLCTDNLFNVLGVPAVLGRTFTPEDGKEGQRNVVVLSYGLWQRRFGGDPNVIGRKVILNQNENTVIGVLPPDFKWHISGNSTTNQSAELWLPLNVTERMKQRSGRFASAVARLKPGASLTQARAELDTLQARLIEQYKEFNTGMEINPVPLREQFADELRPALRVLMGAVGFVLLIACANVANLLLARAATRKKEIAVRAALGAVRARIVRQLLTESLLLAAMGGMVGLLLAWWGTTLLVRLIPPELGVLQGIKISAPVLAFTFLVALLTGVVFGLVPALEATNLKLGETLKEACRSLGGNLRSQRLRNLLVVTEVALALVLLVGAGLLIRSFARLQAAGTGFNAENVLTMRVALPSRRYNDNPKRINFFTQAVEQMRALPGVESAGAINFMPFTGTGAATWIGIEGKPTPLPGQELTTGVCVADQNFFATMQIALKRGRMFTAQEIREARHVVLINEALAKKYFPNEEAVGQRVRIAMNNEPVPNEIIGIIADVKHGQLDKDSEPMSYWPIAELPPNTMTFALRTKGDLLAVAAVARNVIQTLDPQQPVADVRTLASMLGKSVARQRFSTLLLAVFAAVALLLAASGIYGVMSYSVTQRTHELGIRVALGAQRRDVIGLVFRQGVKSAGIGIVIGLAGAWALTRVLTTLLYEVKPTDPLTFLGAPVLLIVVAILACLLPARQAAQVDPITALRQE